MGHYNYLVTAHKASIVTHTATGNFTGPNDNNLIIGSLAQLHVLLLLTSNIRFSDRRCTRVEIHQMGEEGLLPVLDVPVNGRISSLKLFRPAGRTQDLMLVCTER